MQKITPFLWFNNNAEEAVNFYTSIFKESKLGNMTRYDKAGAQVSGMAEGTVMTVSFQLNGQDFTAINGGPHFKFTEAISFVINCKDQEEIDHYWNKLTEGADPRSQQCGWLKDKYGLSWQVVPAELPQLLKKTPKVMEEVLKMKKIDVNRLKEVAG